MLQGNTTINRLLLPLLAQWQLFPTVELPLDWNSFSNKITTLERFDMLRELETNLLYPSCIKSRAEGCLRVGAELIQCGESDSPSWTRDP